MWAEPDDLRALAAEVRLVVARMRSEIDDLEGGIAAVPWQGAAADAFRDTAGLHLALLRAAAGAAAEAAEALLQHADLVGTRRHDLLEAAATAAVTAAVIL